MLCERWQFCGALKARLGAVEWILALCRVVGEEDLALGEEPVHERLCVLLVLGRSEDADGRDVDEGAGVGWVEVVVPERSVRVATELLVQVVVVDEAGINFAGGDGIDDLTVFLKRLGMLGETIEERLRLLVADRLAQGADEAHERGVGRCDSDVSELPVWAGEVQNGGWQRVALDTVGVVGEHANSSGHADPPAGGAAVAGRDEVEICLWERG